MVEAVHGSAPDIGSGDRVRTPAHRKEPGLDPRNQARRTRRLTLLTSSLALVLGSAGCSSLRYKDDAELWTESDEHFNAGRYSDAEPYYDEMLRRSETNTQARAMRGVTHERTGDEADALDDYGTAGSQGEARATLYRAGLNIERGDLVAAEQDLAQLKDAGLGPRDTVRQLTLLGQLRLKQEQWLLAAQSLERAVAAGEGLGDPTMQKHVRDAHYGAGQAYLRLGDFSRGYDHMIAYAEGRSLDPQESYLIGLLAYLSGDFAGSQGYLADADPELVARAADVLDDPSFGAPSGVRKEAP